MSLPAKTVMKLGRDCVHWREENCLSHSVLELYWFGVGDGLKTLE